MYARAGFLRFRTRFPSARVFDWLSHYPAGKWRERLGDRLPATLRRRRRARSEEERHPVGARLRGDARRVGVRSRGGEPRARFRAHAAHRSHRAKSRARTSASACDESSLARARNQRRTRDADFWPTCARSSRTTRISRFRPTTPGPGAPIRWIASREADDFDLWVEQIPFEETRKYTKKVLASYAAYSFLYERSGLDAALRLPKVVAPVGSWRGGRDVLADTSADSAVESSHVPPSQLPTDGRRRSLGALSAAALLGEGGMGAVFEAQDLAGQGRYAIKVLHPEYAHDRQVLARAFTRSRHHVAALHPNIARCFAYAQAEDGSPYIIMELLEAAPLTSYLKPGWRYDARPRGSHRARDPLGARRGAPAAGSFIATSSPTTCSWCGTPPAPRSSRSSTSGSPR